MRLTESQRTAIRESVIEIFGNDAKVFLFGSRVDDSARGGDIDLLIECPQEIENASMLAARVATDIQMKIGEQKIDVLYYWPGLPKARVHQTAIKEGIRL